MCEVIAVAWRDEEAFTRILPWCLELERLGVAGYGWGATWRATGGIVVGYRFPGSLADDAEGRRRLAGVRSDRFLVHLRRPSMLSTATLPDTQPFVAEDGRFAFCHNGTFRHEEGFRSSLRTRLHGRADSEVGFRVLEDVLGEGMDPEEALPEVHRRLGGTANMGYVDGMGRLLLYGGYDHNPVWSFRLDGARVAATSLHSKDESVFDLLFRGAEDRSSLPDRVAVVARRG